MKTRIIILPVKVRIAYDNESDKTNAIREIKDTLKGQAVLAGNYTVEIIGFKKTAAAMPNV